MSQLSKVVTVLPERDESEPLFDDLRLYTGIQRIRDVFSVQIYRNRIISIGGKSNLDYCFH